MQDRINRARELLKTVRHASMATVNPDGSPHNTPYFFMYDASLAHLYWASHPSSQHSKNSMRTGKVFVALYDGNVKGGLYFRADGVHVAEGSELAVALEAHNAARVRFGKTPPVTLAYYQRGEQCMYTAIIRQMWVNLVEYDAAGQHLRDYRQEVVADDLLDSIDRIKI